MNNIYYDSKSVHIHQKKIAVTKNTGKMKTKIRWRDKT